MAIEPVAQDPPGTAAPVPPATTPEDPGNLAEVPAFWRFWAVLAQGMACLILAAAAGRPFAALAARTPGYSPWSGGTNLGFWASFALLILVKDVLPGLRHLRHLFGHSLVPIAQGEEPSPGVTLTPFRSALRQVPWLLPLAALYLFHPYRRWIDPTVGPWPVDALVTDPAWETTLQAIIAVMGIGVLDIVFLNSTGQTLGDLLGRTAARPLPEVSGQLSRAEFIQRSLTLVLLAGICFQVPIPSYLVMGWSDQTRQSLAEASVIDGDHWWWAGLAQGARLDRFRVTPPTAACLDRILSRRDDPVGLANAPTAAAGTPEPRPAATRAPVQDSTAALTGWFSRLSYQVPSFLFRHRETILFDDRGKVWSRRFVD
ncbi:MAG: hypothetical protein GX442_04790 [Candidatus Riflebacteria bacterium]|nr:hypothetical protein [Candidatus Riflebacteria bacterium]